MAENEDGVMPRVGILYCGGAMSGAGELTAVAAFEVVSTQQEDIQSFMPQVRDLVRENSLVWVSESRL